MKHRLQRHSAAAVEEKWEVARPAAGGSLWPNLTEASDIQRNEEDGQKQKCPHEPLFWVTVYANLT